MIREFERRPPHLVGEPAESSSATSHKGQEACSSGRTSPVHVMPEFTPQQVPSFPELLDLSTTQLQQLIQSEDRLDEFINRLPPMQRLNNTVDDMITKNEELAKENLSKHPQLQKLDHSIRKKLDALSVVRNSYESLTQEYQRLSGKYAPGSIKESLRLAVLRADEESERIAEQFLGGKMSVDQFVSKYLKKRTLSQTRKTKEEKLGSQLSELQRAGY